MRVMRGGRGGSGGRFSPIEASGDRASPPARHRHQNRPGPQIQAERGRLRPALREEAGITGILGESLLAFFLLLVATVAAVSIVQVNHLVVQRILLRGDLAAALQAAAIQRDTVAEQVGQYAVIPPVSAKNAFLTALRADLQTNWKNTFTVLDFRVVEPPPSPFWSYPPWITVAGNGRQAIFSCPYPVGKPKRFVLGGPGVFAAISVPISVAAWKGWRFAPLPQTIVVCRAVQSPVYDGRVGSWAGSGTG